MIMLRMLMMVDQVVPVSQISVDVLLTEDGAFWNAEHLQQHKNTQGLVHMSEVCVHHRGCIFYERIVVRPATPDPGISHMLLAHE